MVLSKSSICSGLTTMYRGIEGSTLCASSNFFADTSLATVNPAEPCAIFWPLGNVVEVVPDLPVNAVPPKADMISSSIARPIAAAAARAYELVGSINIRTLSLSSMRSAHSYEVRLTIRRECFLLWQSLIASSIPRSVGPYHHLIKGALRFGTASSLLLSDGL